MNTDKYMTYRQELTVGEKTNSVGFRQNVMGALYDPEKPLNDTVVELSCNDLGVLTVLLSKPLTVEQEVGLSINFEGYDKEIRFTAWHESVDGGVTSSYRSIDGDGCELKDNDLYQHLLDYRTSGEVMKIRLQLRAGHYYDNGQTPITGCYFDDSKPWKQNPLDISPVA